MRKELKVIIIITTLLFSNNILSQFSKEEFEMMEIIKKNGAYIKPSIFLDTSIVKNMKLVNNSGWRHLWVDTEDSLKNIKQFYDIRLKFDSKKEALKFHKKYLGLNSEYSEKIKMHGIKYENASEFYVFKGNAEYLKMMEPYGYQVFCIIYVVDHYFIKQHITCLKEYNPTYFQNFVSNSINKIIK